MFSFLFGGSGSARPPKLILRPDASARSIAGFGSGAEMILVGNAGDTVGACLDRLNTYRGPEQQIRTVWYPETGVAVPAATPIHGDMTVVIKGTSVKSDR